MVTDGFGKLQGHLRFDASPALQPAKHFGHRKRRNDLIPARRLAVATAVAAIREFKAIFQFDDFEFIDQEVLIFLFSTAVHDDLHFSKMMVQR